MSHAQLCAIYTYCYVHVSYINISTYMCHIYILLHTCVIYTYYYIHVSYIHITTNMCNSPAATAIILKNTEILGNCVCSCCITFQNLLIFKDVFPKITSQPSIRFTTYTDYRADFWEICTYIYIYIYLHSCSPVLCEPFSPCLSLSLSLAFPPPLSLFPALSPLPAFLRPLRGGYD